MNQRQPRLDHNQPEGVLGTPGWLQARGFGPDLRTLRSFAGGLEQRQHNGRRYPRNTFG